MMIRLFMGLGCGVWALAMSMFETDFKLYKMGYSEPIDSSTVLVVGGIHGNEEGSYFAPSLFVTHYRVTKGQVWIIPALNRQSIIRNARGLYGDMNRKFRVIEERDRDYEKVTRLKHVITDDAVDMVLNLHDGHGFFREIWKDNKRNPRAWGQTSVIDQEVMDQDVRFGNLYAIARQVSKEVNDKLQGDEHSFRVKNTNTKDRDPEQQNALTFFAIKNGKPAFAVESSKDIKELWVKVFYQLRAIEAYLKIAGVEFERSFDLTPENIRTLLMQYGTLSINDVITLPLDGVSSDVRFMPLKKGQNGKKNDPNVFKMSHPLGGITYRNGMYHVHIGNKHISSLEPDYFRFADQDFVATITVDGLKQEVPMGALIEVDKHFKVHTSKGMRVNVIGFGGRMDAQKTIRLKDTSSFHALDRDAKNYRIEFYKKQKGRDWFMGTVVAKFNP